MRRAFTGVLAIWPARAALEGAGGTLAYPAFPSRAPVAATRDGALLPHLVRAAPLRQCAAAPRACLPRHLGRGDGGGVDAPRRRAAVARRVVGRGRVAGALHCRQSDGAA